MRIIVGVDRSEGAAAALRWAARLALDAGAELVVAEAWQYPPLPLLADAESYAPADEVDGRVTAALGDWVRSTCDVDVAVDLTALRGEGARALSAAAAGSSADLLVVGTRGLGGVDRRLLGSVSRRLSETAPCPVVVVPEGAGEAAGSFVVGLDGTPDSNAAFDLAARLAASCSGEVVMIHCVAPIGDGLPGDALEQGREFGEQLLRARDAELERRGVGHRAVLSFDPPRRALESIAAEEAARLVLIGARGAGSMEKLLLGSVSTYLSTCAERPVAVVRR